jgi:hypothetical protein
MYTELLIISEIIIIVVTTITVAVVIFINICKTEQLGGKGK